MNEDGFPYSGLFLCSSSRNSTCSDSCGCDFSASQPVCGSNKVDYFSPCHAGCTTRNGTGSVIIFFTLFDQCNSKSTTWLVLLSLAKNNFVSTAQFCCCQTVLNVASEIASRKSLLDWQYIQSYIFSTQT